MHKSGRIRTIGNFSIIGFFLLATACAAGRAKVELPPLLTQEEIQRPFTKLAVVQVNRQRYGSSYEPQPDDYTWAHDALREEAAKIGADAVIFPEVKIQGSSYLIFPSSEVEARGIAVRFQ